MPADIENSEACVGVQIQLQLMEGFTAHDSIATMPCACDTPSCHFAESQEEACRVAACGEQWREGEGGVGGDGGEGGMEGGDGGEGPAHTAAAVRALPGTWPILPAAGGLVHHTDPA